MIKFLNSMTWKHVGLAVETLLKTNSYQARKYVSPTEVIKVTRNRYGKSGWTKRDTRADIRLTIGSPGYVERKFIAACKKSGEPFPVSKVQIKALPVKRK